MYFIILAYLHIPSTMTNSFNIRKIRIQKEIKQQELADFLGISQSQLSKMENGLANVTVNEILNISVYTKTPLSEFLPEDITYLQQIDFNIQFEQQRLEIEQLKEDKKHQQVYIRNLEEDNRHQQNIIKQLEDKINNISR